MADQLREDWERQHGVQFSWMIISRMDVFYVKDLVPLRTLDRRNIVYVPDFLSYDGVNDRFALAPPKTGSVYARLYSILCDNNGRLAFHIPKEGASETIFKWHLQKHGIRIGKLPEKFRFGRVRIGVSHPMRQDFIPYDKDLDWYVNMKDHLRLCRERTEWLVKARALRSTLGASPMVLCGVETAALDVGCQAAEKQWEQTREQ
uniref:DUF7796 domain-containing protein n=1 Tax=Eutreptiella gymnastica TaxID=73025 RepID=A0A7S1J0N2_9EUGL